MIEAAPSASSWPAIRLRFTGKPTLFSTSILVLGRGSRPSPTLRTHLCLHPLPTAPSRMAIWHEDSICPLCGQTQDRFGDHALSWVCGGDRVCRRNAVRDVVHSIARDAALSHWSRKNWGSSLPELPVMETQIPPALPIQPTETSAAQPTFGFLAVPLGRQRPGTSPTAMPRARQFGPQWAGTQALFSSEWSLARPPYMALPLALPLEVVGESWSGGPRFLSS